MTIDFQTWMRAVYTSIVEPTDSARKVIAMNVPKQALWTGLILVAILNVILVALMQMRTPMPIAMQEQGFALSPFAFFAIISIFFVLFVYGLFYSGKMIGGVGSLHATLAVVVWLQAVSVTLEAIQLVLLLISPPIGSIFGLLTLGALIWCFVNFINVLHGFANLGKALVAILLALIGTALLSGMVMAVLGIGPTGVPA